VRVLTVLSESEGELPTQVEQICECQDGQCGEEPDADRAQGARRARREQVTRSPVSIPYLGRGTALELAAQLSAKAAQTTFRW